MNRRGLATVRRAMAGMLMVAILAGIIPWRGARAMACQMDRPVTAAPSGCGWCDGGSGAAAAPLLEAGSCCRFAAPEEVSTLPFFTQAGQRAPAGDERVATAFLVESHSAVATTTAVGARTAASSSCSQTPQALSTHLRL